MKKVIRPLFRKCEHQYYRKLIRKNEHLKDRHKGEPAHIFATGTSLLNEDISSLKSSLTIGCNYIFRHPQFKDLNLDYYVVGVPFRRWRQTSQRFTHKDFDDFHLEVNDCLAESSTALFMHATLEAYLKNRNILQKNDKYYFVQRRPFGESKGQEDLNLSLPISLADGSMHLMIALAIYMGSKEIFLHGFGYSYSPVQAFHFYDCLLVNESDVESGLKPAIAEFAHSHPESDITQMEHKLVKVGDGKYLVDFFYFPENMPGYKNLDFYRKDKLLKQLSENIGVKIQNVIPAGYESMVF